MGKYFLVLFLLLGLPSLGNADLKSDSIVDIDRIHDADRAEVSEVKSSLEKIRTETKERLLEQHPDLKNDPLQFERALENAPFGPLDIEEGSVLRGSNLYVVEMGDLRKTGPKATQKKGGALWSAWVETDEDVKTERPRAGLNAWATSDLVGKFQHKLKALPGWSGIFMRSVFDKIQNGWSRGHIRSHRSSGRSLADAWDSFVYYENAHLQSRDSNAGAWRNLEKTMQTLVEKGDFETINYGGALWNDFEYKNLSGETKLAESKMLPFQAIGKKTVEFPVPSAYWRFTLVVPRRDAKGNPISRARGLKMARPITTIVPNTQDSDLFVSDWARYNTSAETLENLLGRELPKELGALLGDYKTKTDNGLGLPREQEMPDWKVDQLVELLESERTTVSKEARNIARMLLQENNVDVDTLMEIRNLPKNLKERFKITRLRYNFKKKSEIRTRGLKKMARQEKMMKQKGRKSQFFIPYLDSPTQLPFEDQSVSDWISTSFDSAEIDQAASDRNNEHNVSLQKIQSSTKETAKKKALAKKLLSPKKKSHSAAEKTVDGAKARLLKRPNAKKGQNSTRRQMAQKRMQQRHPGLKEQKDANKQWHRLGSKTPKPRR